MKCFSLHSADIAQDTGGIGHTSAENKYSAKKFILLRAKNTVQNRSQYQIFRTLSSFMHAIKKNILLHLQSYFKLLPYYYNG